MNTPNYPDNLALNYEYEPEEESSLSVDISLDELFKNRNYWRDLPEFRVSEDAKQCKGVAGEVFHVIPRKFEEVYRDFKAQTGINLKPNQLIGISELDRLIPLTTSELRENDGVLRDVIFDRRSRGFSRSNICNTPDVIEELCREEINLPSQIFNRHFGEWKKFRDELEGAGNTALFKAARRFNSELGKDFFNFAYQIIIRDMKRALFKTRGVVLGSSFEMSLNRPLFKGDDSSEEIVSFIPDKRNCHSETESRLMATKIIEAIRGALYEKASEKGRGNRESVKEFIPRQMDILSDYLGVNVNGEFILELDSPSLGKKYGVSKQGANAICNRIISFIREDIENRLGVELKELYSQYLRD